MKLVVCFINTVWNENSFQILYVISLKNFGYDVIFYVKLLLNFFINTLQKLTSTYCWFECHIINGYISLVACATYSLKHNLTTKQQHNKYLIHYYTLRSSLQIQCSALSDDGTSRAHYLTPGHTCCEESYQNYSHSVFRLFIITEYNFTISVTQFALFRSLETVLVLYNLIIRVSCFDAHVTCIHSNKCGRFDMIEPLNKTLPDFKSPAHDVPSSNTTEHRIWRLDCNM